MTPFNLQRALAGDPVVTRDGRKVEWIAHDPGADPEWRVAVRLEGQPCHGFHNESGCAGSGKPHPRDLFMAPKKRKVWLVNIDGVWKEFAAQNDAVGASLSMAILGSKTTRAYELEIEE